MKTSLFVAVIAMSVVVGSFASAQTKPALPPVKIIKASAAPRAVTPATTAVVAAPAPVVAPVAPAPTDFEDSSQLPSVPVVAPVAVAKPVTRTARTSTLPIMDAAALIAHKCAARPKYKIGCMNRELKAAWAKNDKEELRMTNCSMRGQANSTIRATNEMQVSAALTDVREKLGGIRAAAALQSTRQITAAGRIGPMKLREVRLRASLKQALETRELADKICSASVSPNVTTAH